MSRAPRGSSREPFHGGRCYACDAAAVGYRDRDVEGGDRRETACARHADPTIRVFEACVFCSGPRPTRDIDGQLAHLGCWRRESV